MRTYITSTGTGVGKTFISAAIIGQTQRAGLSKAAYKPVISGFDLAQVAESDTGILLKALGLPPTHENIEHISPWRFSAPLAPSMAARLEGRTIDFNALVAHSRKIMAGPEDIVLIEGVGGVMVPLNDQQTVLDWIAALAIDVMLVAGSYLGTISHTLTALEVLRQRQIPVHSVIVNESLESPVPLANIADELSRWTRLPIVTVRRRADGDWRDVRELLTLLPSERKT
jgi:dethiobiotin synthetase